MSVNSCSALLHQRQHNVATSNLAISRWAAYSRTLEAGQLKTIKMKVGICFDGVRDGADAKCSSKQSEDMEW